MVDIDLMKNSELKKGLLDLGFKKKKIWFVREYKETIQDFGFPYATYGERRTRYYGCNCGFGYPEAHSFAEEHGIMNLFDTGGNIGYIVPQRKFFFLKPKYEYSQWRIAESNTEQYAHNFVSNFLNLIETYAIPFLNSFSTKEAFIDALENNPKRVTYHYDRKLPPILYHLLGDNEKAISYIRQTLELYKKQEENRKNGVEIIETKEYREIRITGGSSYYSYLEFANTFSKSINYNIQFKDELCLSNDN